MINTNGKLYLVPTPIGNLGDITKRALDTLEQVDIIACEDTRHSGRLLKEFNISKKLISYHDFNEAKRATKLLNELQSGLSIAIITDAGTPGISDPAYRIVRIAVENKIEIVPLPGANAISPALTGSGLPTDKFYFDGFLPHKSNQRKKRFEAVKEIEATLIFYESPHRILKSVQDALEVLGNRQGCIAREISKLHEEFIRGSLEEIIKIITDRTIKGEIVLVIEGFNKKRTKSR
ncbi:MAG: 16S rRNA (cytidine(1402)-2'-O)-methyltransferase [Candidatus Zixiibacteriota bacterium]|nr:MAG: 16S rRNA (cytidine(1402)-2'-O)-methyltransferase [candidate division Zixibacteria bacterium]